MFEKVTMDAFPRLQCNTKVQTKAFLVKIFHLVFSLLAWNWFTSLRAAPRRPRPGAGTGDDLWRGMKRTARRAACSRVTARKGREGEARNGMRNAIRLGENLNTLSFLRIE